MATTSAISDPHSFWLAARWQRCCQVPDCGSTGPWHAHHVIPKQLLRRLHLPKHDTRGALRICDPHHMAFEWAGPGKVEIPATCFTDENVCYIFEALGVTACQLEGKYGPLDVRYDKHLTGDCPLCQRT